MDYKFAAFCTSDNKYIPKCVVSLLSFNKYNPTFDLFVITKDPSEKHIELCKRFGIQIIRINLDNYFYKEWDYPSECYYHFKVPELLFEMGYEYSVFFDGDVYCNRKLDFDWSEIIHIGGVPHIACKRFLEKVDNFPLMKKKFGITDDSNFARRHTQAGVLIYNNRGLKNFKYFDKAVRLFDLSIKYDHPRKGDDSLLAFLLGYYKDLEAKYLMNHYNFINKESNSGAYYTGHHHLVSRCVFYHMIKLKPWVEYKEYPNYVYKYFTEKWRETMINRFSQLEIKEYFPQFHINSPVRVEDICYYWWKSATPNFGDHITPYMVKKFCSVILEKPENPLTSKKNVLLSTGSIMRLCRDNTIIWGSGIRDRKQNIKPGKIIRSVRGPLTRKRLIEIGCECPPIFGDPALLLPRLYYPNVEQIYDLAIIPHFSQFLKVKELYRSEKSVLVIDLRTDDIEGVIDKLLKCKCAVSSSLHGIIVANAYNLPVEWIKFSNSIKGDDTKFYDHYASIGVKEKDVTFINAVEYKKISVSELISNTKHFRINLDLDALFEASFFDLEYGIKKYIRYKIT